MTQSHSTAIRPDAEIFRRGRKFPFSTSPIIHPRYSVCELFIQDYDEIVDFLTFLD